MDLEAVAPEVAAPRLLGAVLRVGDVAIRLTEVEAYAGARDPASHAFRGPTLRNRAMFGRGGQLYIYRSYGIHSCVNVVSGPEGEASGILVRAGQVVAGIERARERRGLAPDQDVRLARGPGCVGQALGLDPTQSGLRIDGDAVELTWPAEPVPYTAGPRVGVARAHDVRWRFWIPGDPTVSRYVRSPRAPRS